MGASGQVPYELLVDAFLTDDRNLRSDTVKSLLSSLGVENGWSALVADRALVGWLQTERGPQATVESELNQFVAHRNEAAHGSAAAVLEPDDLVKYAEFARRLGVALGDLIVGEAIAREVALGQAEEIGEVIREFSENVIGCRMRACTVRVGETLLVIDSRSGHEVGVESLEINRTPHDEVQCTDGLELGLKVTKSAREGARLVRRVERDDNELGPAGAPEDITTPQDET
jgi:hypothetical protein